jgi:hypothetical protein
MTSFLPDPMYQRAKLVVDDMRAGRLVPKALLALHLELERALALAPVVRNEVVGDIRIPVSFYGDYAPDG